MELRSISLSKDGWKVEYEDKSKDDQGTPVRIKYPSESGFDLGKPTRDFYQALGQFLRIAIAIGHLDRSYWLDLGEVTAVKLKEGKDTELLQIAVEADDNNTEKPCIIVTPFVELYSAMAIVQAEDPEAPSINKALKQLEEQVELYVNGKRKIEQLELLPRQLEQQSA